MEGTEGHEFVTKFSWHALKDILYWEAPATTLNSLRLRDIGITFQVEIKEIRDARRGRLRNETSS